MEWVSLITTALGLVASVLGYIAKTKEVQEARTYENDTQTIDTALAERDADTLSARFDELHTPPGVGDPGGPDAEKPAERQL